MKTGHKILIAAGAIVVIGGVLAASLLSKQKGKGEEVYLAKAQRQDLVSAVTASGLIEPRTKVNVQSSVIGEIVELPVQEGDTVRQGDLLVQIDPDRYRSEVDRLEATLRISRIAIEQQQVSLENAGRTLQRYQSLSGEGFVSAEQLEKAQLDARLAEINIKSLEEQVTQAEAALAKARDELLKTTIRSPMDGLVTQLNAEKGEMTLTGTMNNPGTVILVVSDMGEVLAEVDVDETRIVKVHPGETAQVVVDAVGELHPYSGKVTEIAGTAVRRTGQEVQVFPVKVALDQPDDRLRPGMTAKARIETEKAENALTIPIQAVLLMPAKEVEKALAARQEEEPGGTPKVREEGKESAAARAAATGSAATSPPGTEEGGGGNPEGQGEEKREVVFLAVAGKAVLTPVKTGTSDETDTIVLEGIAEGDSVITGPYRSLKKLKDGDAVRAKEEAAAGEETERKAGGVAVEVDAEE